MTKYTLPALILFALSGCGGDAGSGTKNAATTANSKPIVQNQNSNAPDQAKVPSNGENGPNAQQNPITLSRNKKIDEMRKAGSDPNAPKPDIEALLTASTRPAPEDSEFSVALADILVERRTFLNNPVLAKVEKTANGQNKVIKVFLKDGRTIDVRGDAIETLSTAASSSILKAAGIAAPVDQQPSDTKSRVRKN